MPATYGVDEAELQRARLTLLVLRGAAPHSVTFRNDAIRLLPSDRILSAHDAALSLALLSKPFTCYGDVVDGVLSIVVRSAGADASVANPRAERYGPDYLDQLVLCTGRGGEWLCLTFRELEAWEAECGWRLRPRDEVDYAYSFPIQLSAAARALGDRGNVRAVVAFQSTSRSDELEGRIYADRLADRRHSCERCRKRVAEYVFGWFENTRPARKLCQRCIDEELDVEQFMEARSHEGQRAKFEEGERTMSSADLTQTAHFWAERWAYKPMPPYVREFVRRHRGY